MAAGPVVHVNGVEALLLVTIRLVSVGSTMGVSEGITVGGVGASDNDSGRGGGLLATGAVAVIVMEHMGRRCWSCGCDGGVR